MKQTDAQQMAEGMSTSFLEHQEQQKQRKATMWARIAAGIVLTVICSLASYFIQNQGGAGLRGIVFLFALVGLFLLISGLWRFAAGPRPTRPEDLTAAWKKEHQS